MSNDYKHVNDTKSAWPKPISGGAEPDLKPWGLLLQKYAVTSAEVRVDAVPKQIDLGGEVQLTADLWLNGELIHPDDIDAAEVRVSWSVDGGEVHPNDQATTTWDLRHADEGTYEAVARFMLPDGPTLEERTEVKVIDVAAARARRDGPLPPAVDVSLKRPGRRPTQDQGLWVAIRNGTNALGFNNYMMFVDAIICGVSPLGRPGSFREALNLRDRRGLPFPDIDTYRLLKAATELFMMVSCGVATDYSKLPPSVIAEESVRLDRPIIGPELNDLWRDYKGEVPIAPPGEGRGGDLNIAVIPYFAMIRKKLHDLHIKLSVEERNGNVERCYGILRSKLLFPCFLELIWSYWHEEGMLVQTLNSVSMRFQNRRNLAGRDPLAALELDPLRPLNNLLWGYVQDEQHRLTVPRRAYEYDHHYGLPIYGKAVPAVHGADSRSNFLEAFHNLLYLCSVFYKEDDDTTVIADGFPVLNAVKEVHLILSQGMHNQYGDLPWTARQEMLMQEWMLARPEMREFLPSRTMVAYVEPWMGPADTMKRLKGWHEASVTHFRDLGVFGEQILLSTRFGGWSGVNDPTSAVNWARYWRPEIQGYIHAYRVVTGVDLAVEAVEVEERELRSTRPSILLQRRLASGDAVPILEPGQEMQTLVPSRLATRRPRR